MNPLGKALSKVLNPSVENATTTFSNNYNGTSVSFEGFFGDLMSKLKPKKRNPEDKIFLGERVSKLPNGDEVMKILEKTVLNKSWQDKFLGKDIEVSVESFPLAFLFLSGDVDSEIKDYFDFVDKLNRPLKKVINEVQKLEHRVVKDYESLYNKSDKNSNEFLNAQRNLFKEFDEAMLAEWGKLKSYSLKHKDLFEVTIGFNRESLTIDYRTEWLKPITAIITTDQMIKFISFLKKSVLYDTWELSLPFVDPELFGGGPSYHDKGPIWDVDLEFDETIGGRLCTWKGLYDDTLFEQREGPSMDMFNGGKNTLMVTLDKMFGSNQ